ncbi:sterile alpha motif domain-containing protein 13 isoform X1 [Pogoniulus pusillus]|uniref:sterile alpha motif domain-containing protein 13 isoform X1 n=2 Tax=Pogoniulus pusillus TaxID=488313 RepID=UPI0030B93F28
MLQQEHPESVVSSLAVSETEMAHLRTERKGLGRCCMFCEVMGELCGKVAEVKETSILPMLTVDMENKENGTLDVKNSVENGRPPDPADWAVIDVVNYFRTAGFEEQANVFQEQEIDGKSLLLMTRNDVLTGLSLKLGPALKIYEYHVKPLQTQHLKNNSL